MKAVVYALSSFQHLHGLEGNQFFLNLTKSAAVAAAQITMAAEPEQAAAAQEATMHIVYVDRPEDDDPEEFHIRTLSPVLGSEEKARDAVLYQYKHAASGFNAKLIAEQVKDLKSECAPSFHFMEFQLCLPPLY
ncbi:subtilisin-like protease SBT3.5 [Hordeum vulgare]|nr:subtilisin-like protease SBT3.5 [Hordeum vulgare]